MLKIVNHLFPTITDSARSNSIVPAEWSPELDVHFTEILELTKGMKLGKAPGPDGAPDVAIMFGFRKGMSTIDAIGAVVDIAPDVHPLRENTANWECILRVYYTRISQGVVEV